jgi:hypothetical protein
MAPIVKHPLATTTTYTTNDFGVVIVERANSQGRFNDSGQWLGGEIRSADPQMCRFLHSCWRLEIAGQQTGEDA